MDEYVIKSKFSDVTLNDKVSLSHYLLEKAKSYGEQIAFIDAVTEEKLTFNTFIKTVNNVAHGLRKHGIKKGDVVLNLLPNCIEYAVILHAVVVQGGMLSTCSPAYTTGEIARQIDNCKAKFVFTIEDLIPKLQDALKKSKVSMKHVFTIDGSPSKCGPFISSYATLNLPNSSTLPFVKISPKEDCAIIPYSSGTSGLPKGVMLSHFNILSNMFQYNHPEIQFGKPGDVYIGFLPFYHIYAIAAYLCQALFHGYTVVVMRDFDPIKYLTHCQKYKVTALHIVPPVAVFLAKHPVVSKFDLSSVEEVFVGAAPLQEDLSNDLLKRLNLKFIRQAYGMTELSPVVTMTSRSQWKHGSAGTVVPNTELKVVDISTGKSLPANKNGEIWARGPQMMLGYLDNPKATAETIDKDGWLHTGDVGYYDKDQNVFVVDRIKELIKYKGFQVAPAELEDLLLTHPSISDAAVIGVPDQSAGELPRAYIVLKPNVKCSEKDIHDFMKENAAYYKHFRGGVVFQSTVPKSPSGKILRRVLREEYHKNMKAKL